MGTDCVVTPETVRAPRRTATAIAGVWHHRLDSHPDSRGDFTEVWRDEWALCRQPVQWNLARNRAGVLRGVHLHHRHHDYLVLTAGSAVFGLADLRAGSPTEGVRICLTITSETLQGLVIPPGVAHGFWFAEPATHLYAVSHYWAHDDELGVRWNDPDLALPWPAAVGAPLLSPRDQTLGPLADLLPQVPVHQA
ncbi:MAG: dTDP-4-dehydrorhamnose 3,5-epimerase family protein [Fimbriimonadaceae bacterium]|nr:dTDP-4-dehydrorhamnose 3,5-epimerase family protein [Fimbriimonadaceae bacterium]